MGLKWKEVRELKKYFNNTHRPLVFFDDDCDGLSSFLQLYKHVGEGKGVPVKDSPQVHERYARKASEYGPDTVFVFDKPGMQQEFADKVKQDIVWLDHHEPQDVKGVKYYNPRVNDDEDNKPTSYWMYKVLKKNLWIAMTGVVADWHLPKDIAKKFRKEYPDLLPKDIKTPDAAIFDSGIGKLSHIWNFNLKGTVRDTMDSVKTLTRINDPYEILEQKTPKGKFIYKKYEKAMKVYDNLKDQVKIGDEGIILFKYKDSRISLTSDLSNELLYRNPDKVIVIGRHDEGYVKCSLRSKDINIAQILGECLKGVDGYGGGHKNACGCCVSEKDWDKFFKCFKKKISQQQRT